MTPLMQMAGCAESERGRRAGASDVVPATRIVVGLDACTSRPFRAQRASTGVTCVTSASACGGNHDRSKRAFPESETDRYGYRAAGALGQSGSLACGPERREPSFPRFYRSVRSEVAVAPESPLRRCRGLCAGEHSNTALHAPHVLTILQL